jgi:hypothetical protein
LPYLGGTPGNPNCIWNDQNRLIGAALNVAVDPVDAMDRAYYSYDAEGTRVRKVVVAGGNVKRVRRYLGGYEVFQHTSGGAITARHTLHVMGDVFRSCAFLGAIDDGGIEQVGGDVAEYSGRRQAQYAPVASSVYSGAAT